MSTPKDIIFDEQAREALFKGIKCVADVVACTLGPRGRNVGLEKSWGAPQITCDGGAIAKEISLKDAFENMGALMAQEVVQKIKEASGDGTTTGTILLKALVEEGVKQIAAGASPIGIKRGMDKAIEAVVKEIQEKAIAVEKDEDIKNIATVSASGNEEIGTTIAQAMKMVNRKGVIIIEEGKGTETVIDLVEGMEFDRGYLSPYFCTNTDKMMTEMTNPQIFLIDKKVTTIHDILPILQSVASTGDELLIIAEDIEGDALSTLVINKLRGILKVCAVKAPGFGDRRKEMMEDIAILTGATVVSEDAGMNLQEVSADVLGSAERISISKNNCVIVNGKGNQAQIQQRIAQLDLALKACENSYDQEKIEGRKAKLSGGVAVIRVGAATEPALRQEKQIYTDSLSSTKSAIAGGITAGGGLALLRAREIIETLSLEGDEKIGGAIVKKACTEPLHQIATNTGADGSVILNKVDLAKGTHGFNALTNQVEDLLKAGVIDPANVVVNSLIYAASAAATALLTEALITDAQEEDNE